MQHDQGGTFFCVPSFCPKTALLGAWCSLRVPRLISLGEGNANGPDSCCSPGHLIGQKNRYGRKMKCNMIKVGHLFCVPSFCHPVRRQSPQVDADFRVCDMAISEKSPYVYASGCQLAFESRPSNCVRAPSFANWKFGLSFRRFGSWTDCFRSAAQALGKRSLSMKHPAQWRVSHKDDIGQQTKGGRSHQHESQLDHYIPFGVDENRLQEYNDG
jgi:hypothetical protein